VVTTSDVINGDVATVARLIANPGPDGISLREGLQATNNDPGTYTIGFAPALAGATITLDDPLPALTGGGVTVEGDIDGNGKPDVTLRASARIAQVPDQAGLQISSSANRLHALTLEDFFTGMFIRPYWDGMHLPANLTYADNVVSNLVIHAGRGGGIILLTVWGPECGLPKPQPCPSHNRWANTTLTGNTIEADGSGIGIDLRNGVGDRLERASVTDNTIRMGKDDGFDLNGTGIGFFDGGNATGTRISDLLIARNSIEGVNGDRSGIVVAPGVERAEANRMERVRILDNHVHLVTRGSRGCCQAIVLQAGTDSPAAAQPDVLPVRYPDRNVLRNVTVRRNAVSGTLVWGVIIQAGIGAGGSRNLVQKVAIERNLIRSSTVAFGVAVQLGDGMPYMNRYATANRATSITIDANRITIGNANPFATAGLFLGGVQLMSGGRFGRGGAVRNVRVTNNRIATRHAGIKLIGGFSPTSHGNSVTCVRLARNRITGTHKRVSVRSNVGGASRNRASLGGC
jgi:hypothetical protein